MAAYAAAGIAKSDPIKTGLQGFAYDIRTAILPFAFFFNNKLLLIEGVDAMDPNDPSKWQWITNPAEISLIFIAAVCGNVCILISYTRMGTYKNKYTRETHAYVSRTIYASTKHYGK